MVSKTRSVLKGFINMKQGKEKQRAWHLQPRAAGAEGCGERCLWLQERVVRKGTQQLRVVFPVPAIKHCICKLESSSGYVYRQQVSETQHTGGLQGIPRKWL